MDSRAATDPSAGPGVRFPSEGVPFATGAAPQGIYTYICCWYLSLYLVDVIYPCPFFSALMITSSYASTRKVVTFPIYDTWYEMYVRRTINRKQMPNFSNGKNYPTLIWLVLVDVLPLPLFCFFHRHFFLCLYSKSGHFSYICMYDVLGKKGATFS